jgi:hypothetical protein
LEVRVLVSGAAKELLIAMASGSKVRSGKTGTYMDVDSGGA